MRDAGAMAATTMTPQQGTGTDALQRIKHGFVITLENKSYDVTFGTSSQAIYLNGTLKPTDALTTNYYATGHVSHDNYIAMISGQPPSLDYPVGLSDLQRFQANGHHRRRHRHRERVRVSGKRQDTARPIEGQGSHLEGLHGRHGQRSRPRERDLLTSRAEHAGRSVDAVRHNKRRNVTHRRS